MNKLNSCFCLLDNNDYRVDVGRIKKKILELFRPPKIFILFTKRKKGFLCITETLESSLTNVILTDLTKGMGTYFTNKLLEYLLEKNTYVIYLQCIPESSEIFWRKLCFKDVPSNIHYWDRQMVHLFKPLVSCAQETSNHNGTDYIEIWDNEPYATIDKGAKWKWNLI